jgi:hypothetical protein
MLVVETVAKIRREHGRGKSIKALMRETGLSRNTIRKAIRAESAQFSYRRAAQPGLSLAGSPNGSKDFWKPTSAPGSGIGCG